MLKIPLPVTAFVEHLLKVKCRANHAAASYFIPSGFINDLRVQLQAVIGHGTVLESDLLSVGWHCTGAVLVYIHARPTGSRLD
jgi:hypothetical protein